MTTVIGDGATGLLDPGAGTGYAVSGDRALLAALVRAETAWVDVLAEEGSAPAALPAMLRDSLGRQPLDVASLARRAEEGGNPVIPLVDDLRAAAGGGEAARFVHRGLTSQDVLDTALMLVAADALDAVSAALTRTADALAGHAETHRATVMVGRTLTQHAVPTTFGLKAAQWLAGVQDALDDVRRCRGSLPVQCGGAAGTMAGLAVAAATRAEGSVSAHPTATDLAVRWAERLGLTCPAAPWHTRRRPVTRLGDTLASTVSAVAHLATDVATLSRPEIGELDEGGGGEGRGRSSTMPHKRNPVLSVLVRSAGMQAGPLAGVLHQCAALAVDERSDGAWHAEWPTLQRLLVLTVTATEQGARLAEDLTVNTGAMAVRVDGPGPADDGAGGVDALLAEWRGLSAELPAAPPVPLGAKAADYLGAAPRLTDDLVRHWRERTDR